MVDAVDETTLDVARGIIGLAAGREKSSDALAFVPTFAAPVSDGVDQTRSV
ncbi:hypothetical protein [Mycobacterium paraintracellulare]|uniref:hypothetical protein n=1 Tax=Mycobacterium paraintracellulare TaxID=1138383 RepID=UPI001916061C|nr:hypothetical protein [Mycobacterium paraintracellulare]